MRYLIGKSFHLRYRFTTLEMHQNPIETMLDHQKLILEQLSYDKELFRKEIVKSFRWLKSYEIISLHRWLKARYQRTHADVIQEVFEYITA